MKRSVPSHYKALYSAEQIQAAVARIGSELSSWAEGVAQQTGRDLLAVPVLRGGIYFFADLTRQIQCSVEIAPGRTRSYESGENAVQRSEVKVNLDGVELKERSVLLIDDICDSGRTLKVLSEFVMKQGAREVRSAVLIHRIVDTVTIKPDWSGFEHRGAEWFVGYGLDDANRNSNLPAIYTIEGAQ